MTTTTSAPQNPSSIQNMLDLIQQQSEQLDAEIRRLAEVENRLAETCRRITTNTNNKEDK
ncbi:hypothetical protein SELR_pSRC500140 (plasmid) [Selenomonas ruminantium subsp. lactilytica TAM6421]|uniref:Uncharacterized protein n=1 Tax=Selenomonas ruminantium subsp. lactilytica (strain NBRC 103574 / TAM6421) TaxID=927704 RepID=I0GWQ1_SELRL|nr:hypothetical protein [Selenomonas ruminantium]BAL85188.1 hypothetical protein SELR_pSRC500140 [Selenomonas ruminantium subsp. lactilytica TAM6421]